MQKTVKKELIGAAAIVGVLSFITLLYAGGVLFFNPSGYSSKIAEGLSIKTESAANYPFPPVKASIFSSLIVIKPEPVKTVVKQELPPVDPYEAVNKELRSLSFFGKSGESVFLAKGDNMYTVKTGDLIENKYTVKEIKENAVILGIQGDETFKFEIISK